MTKRRKGPHEALDALAFNDETVFAFEAKWSRTSRDMDEYAKFMVKNAQNAGHIVPHDLLSYSNCSRHVIVASGILSSGVVIPGDPAQPAPVVAAAKRQDSWYAGVPFLLPKHLRATLRGDLGELRASMAAEGCGSFWIETATVFEIARSMFGSCHVILCELAVDIIKKIFMR